MGQREAHDRVAGLQQRVVDGRVGLRAGVRLDVGVLGAEQRLRAVDRELLDHVDVLAAAVVALARVALGVLVGEHAALALQDRLRHEVLRGDHLQRALLAVELEVEGLGDLGVDVGERALEVVGRQVGHRPGSKDERALDRTTGSGRLRRRPRCRARAPRPRAARPTRRRARSAAGRRPSTACRAARRRRARGPRRRGSSSGTSSSRCASVPPAAVGRALQHGPAHRTQRPASPRRAGTRRPSVCGSGPHASGKRRSGLGSSAVTPPGSSRSSSDARARLELRERGERQLGVEEHDRGGLVGAAALERVEARDGLARVRLARQAVDGVGGEHGDAADADAAGERLGVGRAQHQRRPTTTRSMPGEVRDRLRLAEAGRAHDLRDRLGLPGADLEREQRRARGRGGGREPADQRRGRRLPRRAPARARGG